MNRRSTAQTKTTGRTTADLATNGSGGKAAWPELDDSIAVRFIDTSQALLAVVTSDGALTWANDGWEGQLGWTAAAMAELAVTGLLHPDDVSPFRGALLYLAETEYTLLWLGRLVRLFL